MNSAALRASDDVSVWEAHLGARSGAWGWLADNSVGLENCETSARALPGNGTQYPAANIPDQKRSVGPLHSSSSPSSHASEDGADMTPTSRPVSPDILVPTRERVPSRRDARDLIKMAFVNALPKQRISSGEIAEHIGAAENTVDGWRRDGVMSAEFLMIMQVRYPQFEGELRRLFKLQRELSPDFHQQLMVFVQQMQRGA